jgi:curved DNA-binding protein CbpA
MAQSINLGPRKLATLHPSLAQQCEQNKNCVAFEFRCAASLRCSVDAIDTMALTLSLSSSSLARAAAKRPICCYSKLETATATATAPTSHRRRTIIGPSLGAPLLAFPLSPTSFSSFSHSHSHSHHHHDSHRRHQRRSRTASGNEEEKGRSRRSSSARPAIDAQWHDAHMTLGIKVGSPLDEARRAFVRLALQLHPDKATTSPTPATTPTATKRAAGHDEFVRVRSAYETIRAEHEFSGAGRHRGGSEATFPSESPDSCSRDALRDWYVHETGGEDLSFGFAMTDATRQEVADVHWTMGQGGLDRGGMWEMARQLAADNDERQDQDRSRQQARANCALPAGPSQPSPADGASAATSTSTSTSTASVVSRRRKRG